MLHQKIIGSSEVRPSAADLNLGLAGPTLARHIGHVRSRSNHSPQQSEQKMWPQVRRQGCLNASCEVAGAAQVLSDSAWRGGGLCSTLASSTAGNASDPPDIWGSCCQPPGSRQR